MVSTTYYRISGACQKITPAGSDLKEDSTGSLMALEKSAIGSALGGIKARDHGCPY